MNQSHVCEVYAFPSSVNEEIEHRAKFPALASRSLTKKAMSQGAKVWRWLRTPCEYTHDWRNCLPSYVQTIGDISDGIVVVDDGKIETCHGNESTAGTCVAFRLIYDPESSVIKSLQTRDFEKHWYNLFEQKEVLTEISKNVPIITFGGKEYIWYNREECEEAYARGEVAVMDLESLYLEERAEAFNTTSDDYSFATEQQKQYERILLENATEEEKALLCKVRMDSRHFYNYLEIIPPTETIKDAEAE